MSLKHYNYSILFTIYSFACVSSVILRVSGYLGQNELISQDEDELIMMPSDW
jgi:hypothetical protein